MYLFASIKFWLVKSFFLLNFILIKHEWMILRRCWVMFYFKNFKHLIRLICWRLKLKEDLCFPYQVSVYSILKIIPNKPDNKIRFLIVWLPTNDIFSSHKFTKKEILPSQVFEIHVFEIGGNSEFPTLPVEILKCCLKKMLVSLKELSRVVGLVSTEDTPSAYLPCYWKKMNILEFCRFKD